MRRAGFGTGGGDCCSGTSRGRGWSSGSSAAWLAPGPAVPRIRRHLGLVDLRLCGRRHTQGCCLVAAILTGDRRLGPTGVVAALWHLDAVVLARLDRVVHDDRRLPGLRPQRRTQLRHGRGVTGPEVLDQELDGWTLASDLDGGLGRLGNAGVDRRLRRILVVGCCLLAVSRRVRLARCRALVLRVLLLEASRTASPARTRLAPRPRVDRARSRSRPARCPDRSRPPRRGRKPD